MIRALVALANPTGAPSSRRQLPIARRARVIPALALGATLACLGFAPIPVCGARHGADAPICNSAPEDVELLGRVRASKIIVLATLTHRKFTGDLERLDFRLDKIMKGNPGGLFPVHRINVRLDHRRYDGSFNDWHVDRQYYLFISSFSEEIQRGEAAAIWVPRSLLRQPVTDADFFAVLDEPSIARRLPDLVGRHVRAQVDALLAGLRDLDARAKARMLHQHVPTYGPLGLEHLERGLKRVDPRLTDTLAPTFARLSQKFRLQQIDPRPLPVVAEWCGMDSRISDRACYMISRRGLFERLWARHKGGSPPGDTPEIDFERYMVFAFFNLAEVHTDRNKCFEVVTVEDRRNHIAIEIRYKAAPHPGHAYHIIVVERLEAERIERIRVWEPGNNIANFPGLASSGTRIYFPNPPLKEFKGKVTRFVCDPAGERPFFRVTSDADWRALWERHSGGLEIAPAVDFEIQEVIACFFRYTGQVEVGETNHGLRIDLATGIRGPPGHDPPSCEYACYFAILPRTKLPVDVTCTGSGGCVPSTTLLCSLPAREGP